MADEPNNKAAGSNGQLADGLPLAPLDREELLRQDAELAAKMLAKLEQACQPASPTASGGNKLGARKDAKFKAICTAPSINWTPVGSGRVPVPYQTVQDLSNSMSTASTVRFNGLPAYLLDQTKQTKGTGDERGTGKGIRSGTVTGEIMPVSGCKTVRIEGTQVVREGDKCTMNGGNNSGVFVTLAHQSNAISSTIEPKKYLCETHGQAQRNPIDPIFAELRQINFYQFLGKGFPGLVDRPHFFEPIKKWGAEEQHLRTANNLVIALLGPLSVPAVVERMHGATEETVAAANSVGAGLFSILGAGILGRQAHKIKQGGGSRPTTSLRTNLPIFRKDGLKIAALGKGLKYQSSSGVRLKADPTRTTTLLGSYAKDMRNIVQETGNIKSVNFGARNGDFNILNVPDELHVSPKKFWEEYNRPWLEKAIRRNDRFLMATKPGFEVPPTQESRNMSVLTKKNPKTGKTELSIFGREYLTLRRSGYRYENGEMTR